MTDVWGVGDGDRRHLARPERTPGEHARAACDHDNQPVRLWLLNDHAPLPVSARRACKRCTALWGQHRGLNARQAAAQLARET